MTMSNLDPNAGSVKQPRQGGFHKPMVAAAPETNVASLEEARRAQQEAQELEWLLSHRTDARTGKLKPPSLESIYANHMTTGRTGQWACQASEATGAIIHRWNKTYWQAVNTEVGAVMASDWLERHGKHASSSRKAQTCWDYAAMRLRRLNPLPVLDRKRAIVPCTDAYIEVLPAGFQVLAPDPALGMTHAVKVETGAMIDRPYIPQKLPANSLFAKFLARALPDPAVRALVQEQCGMTLLPGNYSQAAWWYGAAGSGKSTLAELVEAMHRQSVRLNLETLGDRFSLEPLVGASLILVDEVECEKWAEGRFKTLVSGNGIGIDRKNEKALASYHSRAKWLITSNSGPFIRDKSDGVWRRLAVVYWSEVIPENERIPDFQKIILEKEAKLVLDWMLEGAQRIVKRGRTLSEQELPEAVRKAKQRARHNSDSVRAWADEMRVSHQPGEWKPMAEIYKQYETWCSTQGFLAYEILSSKQFWRGMSAAGLTKPDRKSNRRIDGKQADCYELEVLGKSTDLVREWATCERVSTQTNRVLSASAIYRSYSKWAAPRVEGKVLSQRNFLTQPQFFDALAQAGYIDTASKVTDGYRLKIIGSKPPETHYGADTSNTLPGAG